ncbi:hypothetical protein LZ575_10735 [Antarcticibacterium sp. 1MA-6-2]|uniref:hypothetical protein n=1 Tax=Antarcticibacterium sp. 1MA-6-2 TaxID=2908210 RepID=UPI001F3185FE|nr:hypothetical protein [Antarcticibacterium sp. 1MA-6-2]UJH92841.1 hypothetical protein LZ575_10735 [Antarcticibacterium sp. 1MA-6-2]
MKRFILMTSLIFFSSMTLFSCRESEKETVVREVEVEKVEEKVEPQETEEKKGILERTGERVDNEVNEEIDEEIDRIGDDT